MRWTDAVDYLVCPVCRRGLSIVSSPDAHQGVLGHTGGHCDEIFPVIDGVPRLLIGDARAMLYRARARWFQGPNAGRFRAWAVATEKGSSGLALVSRFDREWDDFDQVGTPEHSLIFSQYFDLVPTGLLAPGSLVVDAGCGGGRWAYEVARRGARVIAVDLGLSIDVAARNTRELGVVCVQGDVVTLPIRSSCVDLAYSLGVLHHVSETSAALKHVVEVIAPGGTCLLYLYYAPAARGVAYRALFAIVNQVRRITSRLPRLLVVAFSDIVALVVYLPLARLSRALRALGLIRAAQALPLSYYADRSFRIIRNDSLDRFGTSLEKRFTRDELYELMASAGLSEVRISADPPYWHATGRAPGPSLLQTI